MDEKGIIKFECIHQFTELYKSIELDKLIEHRNLACQKGYIGVYPNGIGFGNISTRKNNEFLISGSATGMITKASEKHFSLVTKWDANNNKLWCNGPVKASSESLTHAVIYDRLPMVNAILHIHSNELWKKYYHLLPSTSAEIEYGTPEMPKAVENLMKSKNFKDKGVFLMKGHQDGIVTFANTIKKTLSLISEL
jgi:ribulose-5-phosphate 4-epimerase/fuculose-1-phosphate aldolase